MGISIEVIGIFIGVCEAKGPGTLFCCIGHRYTQRLAHAVVCLVGIMFVGRCIPVRELWLSILGFILSTKKIVFGT